MATERSIDLAQPTKQPLLRRRDEDPTPARGSGGSDVAFALRALDAAASAGNNVPVWASAMLRGAGVDPAKLALPTPQSQPPGSPVPAPGAQPGAQPAGPETAAAGVSTAKLEVARAHDALTALAGGALPEGDATAPTSPDAPATVATAGAPAAAAVPAATASAGVHAELRPLETGGAAFGHGVDTALAATAAHVRGAAAEATARARAQITRVIGQLGSRLHVAEQKVTAGFASAKARITESANLARAGLEAAYRTASTSVDAQVARARTDVDTNFVHAEALYRTAGVRAQHACNAELTRYQTHAQQQRVADPGPNTLLDGDMAQKRYDARIEAAHSVVEGRKQGLAKAATDEIAKLKNPADPRRRDAYRQLIQGGQAIKNGTLAALHQRLLTAVHQQETQLTSQLDRAKQGLLGTLRRAYRSGTSRLHGLAATAASSIGSAATQNLSSLTRSVQDSRTQGTSQIATAVGKNGQLLARIDAALAQPGMRGSAAGQQLVAARAQIVARAAQAGTQLASQGSVVTAQIAQGGAQVAAGIAQTPQQLAQQAASIGSTVGRSLDHAAASAHTQADSVVASAHAHLAGVGERSHAAFQHFIEGLPAKLKELTDRLGNGLAQQADHFGQGLDANLRGDSQHQALYAEMVQKADEAAAQVQPRWKAVARWAVIILVAVVVIVAAFFLAPLIIGLVGAGLAALGVGSALAATVIGGAIFGALSGAAAGAVTVIGTNLIDMAGVESPQNADGSAQHWYSGVADAAFTGAWTGALGGLIGAGIGSVLSKLPIWSFVADLTTNVGIDALSQLAHGNYNLGAAFQNGIMSGTISLAMMVVAARAHVRAQVPEGGVAPRSRIPGVDRIVSMQENMGNAGSRLGTRLGQAAFGAPTELHLAQESYENVGNLQRTVGDRVEVARSSQPFDGPQRASGDFVHAMRDGDEVHILAGDVTGHGAGAAAKAVRLHEMLDGAHGEALRSGSIVGLDRSLEGSNAGLGSNEQITGSMTHTVIDTKTGAIRVQGGGDSPFFILKPDGRVVMLERPGIALGDGMNEMLIGEAPMATHQLEPGDQVVTLSDGVWDRFGRTPGDSEALGPMADLLARRKPQTAEDTVRLLRAGPLRRLRLADDNSVVAFRWKGPESAPEAPHVGAHTRADNSHVPTVEPTGAVHTAERALVTETVAPSERAATESLARASEPEAQPQLEERSPTSAPSDVPAFEGPSGELGPRTELNEDTVRAYTTPENVQRAREFIAAHDATERAAENEYLAVGHAIKAVNDEIRGMLPRDAEGRAMPHSSDWPPELQRQIRAKRTTLRTLGRRAQRLLGRQRAIAAQMDRARGVVVDAESHAYLSRLRDEGVLDFDVVSGADANEAYNGGKLRAGAPPFDNDRVAFRFRTQREGMTTTRGHGDGGEAGAFHGLPAEEEGSISGFRGRRENRRASATFDAAADQDFRYFSKFEVPEGTEGFLGGVAPQRGNELNLETPDGSLFSGAGPGYGNAAVEWTLRAQATADADRARLESQGKDASGVRPRTFDAMVGQRDRFGMGLSRGENAQVLFPNAKRDILDQGGLFRTRRVVRSEVGPRGTGVSARMHQTLDELRTILPASSERPVGELTAPERPARLQEVEGRIRAIEELAARYDNEVPALGRAELARLDDSIAAHERDLGSAGDGVEGAMRRGEVTHELQALRENRTYLAEDVAHVRDSLGEELTRLRNERDQLGATSSPSEDRGALDRGTMEDPSVDGPWAGVRTGEPVPEETASASAPALALAREPSPAISAELDRRTPVDPTVRTVEDGDARLIDRMRKRVAVESSGREAVSDRQLDIEAQGDRILDRFAARLKRRGLTANERELFRFAVSEEGQNIPITWKLESTGVRYEHPRVITPRQGLENPIAFGRRAEAHWTEDGVWAYADDARGTYEYLKHSLGRARDQAMDSPFMSMRSPQGNLTRQVSELNLLRRDLYAFDWNYERAFAARMQNDSFRELMQKVGLDHVPPEDAYRALLRITEEVRGDLDGPALAEARFIAENVPQMHGRAPTSGELDHVTRGMQREEREGIARRQQAERDRQDRTAREQQQREQQSRDAEQQKLDTEKAARRAKNEAAVQAAEANASATGVLVERFTLYAGTKDEQVALVIKPIDSRAGGSRLNQFAYALDKNMGVRTIWRELPEGWGASFQASTKTISISEGALHSGAPTLLEAHEARHAYIATKGSGDEASIYSGALDSVKRPGATARTLPGLSDTSIYATHLSLDEISTYTQDTSIAIGQLRRAAMNAEGLRESSAEANTARLEIDRLKHEGIYRAQTGIELSGGVEASMRSVQTIIDGSPDKVTFTGSTRTGMTGGETRENSIVTASVDMGDHRATFTLSGSDVGALAASGEAGRPGLVTALKERVRVLGETAAAAKASFERIEELLEGHSYGQRWTRNDLNTLAAARSHLAGTVRAGDHVGIEGSRIVKARSSAGVDVPGEETPLQQSASAPHDATE